MGGTQKQYSLSFAEIMWLIVEGYNVKVAEETGFTLSSASKAQIIADRQEELIEVARTVVPFPFP